MNNGDQIKNNPEPEAGLVGNVCGSHNSSACPDDKRCMPVLYVPQTTGNNNKQDLVNESISTSNNSFPIPKITGTASLAQNGKFVHVQQSNSNAVLVGTLLRSSPKGQEVIPHKVLLTAVKSKDSSPMTRLILPRPSHNSQQLSASTTKQFCRSINMIPCTQGTLMTSAITVKTAEGTSKLLQPNIFRQRTMDGKIITTSSGIPISSGIIVPGKSSPPTLTLIKSSKSGQSQTNERKFVVLDMKEREKPTEKPSVETKSEPELNPRVELNFSTTDDKLAVITEAELISKDCEGSDSSKKPADSEAIIKIQSRCPDLVVKKVGPEVVVKVPSTPPALIPRKPALISSPESVSKKLMDEKNRVSSDKPQGLSDSTPIVSSSSEELSLKTSNLLLPSTTSEPQGEGLVSPLQREAPKGHEKTVSLLGGTQKRAQTSLLPRESVPFPREVTSTPSEGRARKRKGSLNSGAVSSPSKNRAVLDSYENMKLLPGAEDLNPFKAIEWDDEGIGLLPESEIKVVLNEFGMLELKASMKQLEKNRHGKIDDAEEIFCCVQCRCYGLISEFFNESYCSLSCKEELMAQQLSLVNLEDLEPLEFNYSKEKKKNLDNSNIKKPSIITEISKNKSLSNKSSTADEEFEDLMGEEVVNFSVTESDIDEKTASQKNLNIEPTSHKIKKLLPKTNKSSSKLLKSPKSIVSSLTSQEPGNKSKIKLRPRSVIKNNKYSEEFVAQDLDAGSLVSEKPDNSKKQSGFRWSTYLNQTKAIPVWVKLFKNPYPSKPNRFKVGQRLEAIDPEHQSYFCLVSVAEVKGYRLKLHFDGYPSDYDFWVNADSPNIFPPEFCSSHGIPLYPPPGIPLRSFDWNTYLARNNAKAAPATFFETSNDPVKPNLFKVDMKLEAVDRKNTYLVCVATVAAVMENRILIHFDSWGDMYDYWVDITSPYIRPVGWCQNNYHELTPPNGIDPDHFSWKRYLKDTKSIAAPEKAFILRQPIEFKKGMKIEAVDKRAPHLIRVATISAVLPYQIHITFDGFPPHFGYWVDDDSPDIHPIGWASRAGHPLEPPPTTEDLLKSPCKSPGCVGQGYLKGTKYETHTEFEDCPYVTEHLTKDTSLNNRLKWSFSKFKKYGEEFCTVPDDSDEESDDEMEHLRWAWLKEVQNLRKNLKRIPEKECNEICKPLTLGRSSNPQEEKTILKDTASQTSDIYKFESITNSAIDQEETKIHLGPTSPLIISEERTEKSSSGSIKTEEDSKTVDDVITETSGSSVNEIKDKFANVFIKEVNQNSYQLNLGENSDTSIKIEEIDDSILNKVPEVKMELDDPLSSSDDNMDLPAPEINESKLSPSISPACKNFDPEESFDEDLEIRNSSDISLEGHDSIYEKSMLEEKNVLRWTISQVSQFTRPLITSCSRDCFLKEGIDGAGLLMLNKTDLLEYLGLSDSDAERVFSKISSLRQKVI